MIKHVSIIIKIVKLNVAQLMVNIELQAHVILKFDSPGLITRNTRRRCKTVLHWLKLKCQEGSTIWLLCVLAVGNFHFNFLTGILLLCRWVTASETGRTKVCDDFGLIKGYEMWLLRYIHQILKMHSASYSLFYVGCGNLDSNKKISK